MGSNSSVQGGGVFYVILAMFAPPAIQAAASIFLFHSTPKAPPYQYIPWQFFGLALVWMLVISAAGGILLVIVHAFLNRYWCSARQKIHVAEGLLAGWIIILASNLVESLIFMTVMGVVSTALLMHRVSEATAWKVAYTVGGVTLGMALSILAFADGHSYASVHFAAGAGDVEALRSYLDGDASLVCRRDENGETPLFHAVRRNHTSAVQLLLDYGAEVDVKSNDGNTLLDWGNNEEIRELITKSLPKRD